jgi:hypothetical protein
MDHEENKCEDKKNVDKSGRYMEYDERADPGKEQQKREHQEYKAHHEPSCRPDESSTPWRFADHLARREARPNSRGGQHLPYESRGYC